MICVPCVAARCRRAARGSSKVTCRGWSGSPSPLSCWPCCLLSLCRAEKPSPSLWLLLRKAAAVVCDAALLFSLLIFDILNGYGFLACLLCLFKSCLVFTNPSLDQLQGSVCTTPSISCALDVNIFVGFWLYMQAGHEGSSITPAARSLLSCSRAVTGSTVFLRWTTTSRVSRNFVSPTCADSYTSLWTAIYLPRSTVTVPSCSVQTGVHLLKISSCILMPCKAV